MGTLRQHQTTAESALSSPKTSTYMYTVVCPNFQGEQFSQIDKFKHFMETIFADPLLLTTPLDRMYVYAHNKLCEINYFRIQ